MSITSTTSEAASLASGSSAAQSKASMKTRDETLTPASTLSQIEGADEVQLPEASEGSFVSEELAIANAEAKKLLKCIEKGNQQLESLLTLRSGVDPSSILGPVDTEELDRKMGDVKHIQLGLRRLHGALARSNSPSNATEAGMHFSIQVHEEPEKLAADLLESSENLPITIGESWIFTLHGHMAGTPESESALLYVESKTPNSARSFNEEPGENLANIHHKLVELVSSDEPDEYQLLGRMRSSNTSLDSHLVVAHTLSKWGAPRHLKAVLSDAQYAQSKATERLQLARLMTVGFIYMKEVLAATERYPRPDKILFYSQASDPDAEPYSADNELEEILNPFLSIGLGQKKAGTRRPVGTTSGLTKRSVNSLAELSLVLFQVASGMALDYGAGDTGFREAVKEARLNMHKLDERCGPLITEVVQLCLDKTTGEDLFKLGGEEEYRFMERLRRWYQKREEAVR
ncbi:hypothetical protein NPX13_g8399 [Xylaria arbuscula]|uniref:Uncharacterized protein n=1 Tax=Xylaria arbuscula TaxID=114810 RepID=A0A9W8N8I0_9PEZI|nr:hypothetical protein NPX13_g8399 [Xylaria arbuscula]